jgi:hypothetical protein
MHEAYLGGGISEIQKFLEARIIDSATLEAWRRIDAGRRSGDTTALDEGNRTLLFREQHDIIDRFYIRMLDHRSPEGTVFTYLLTLAGAPSIPGGRSYPEEYPLVLRAAVPRIAVSLRTPLADGNIAIFANRWQLIEDNTLPDYLSLLREHPNLAHNLVETPIADRVANYRLIARAGNLAKAAITRWDLDVGLAAPGQQTMRARPKSPCSPRRPST